MPVDLRSNVKDALYAFSTDPLALAAKKFLSLLGYASDRSILLPDSKPKTFLEFVRSSGGKTSFNEGKALFEQWVCADLLFQLTDDELSRSTPLFKETNVNARLLRSYLFFAIELRGGDYSRSKLTDVARQINRIFPMPVMVFIKHQTADKKAVLSVAVINRRQDKREADKDVLGKVTIIRNVALDAPHHGHLEILNSLVLKNLEHPERLPIDNFDRLHEAWERIFDVELLNEQFYQELANWYFWALDEVEFPDDIEKDRDIRNATSLIRLLTRLIFCWFLREKEQLIPEKLFSEADLKKILVNLSDNASTYYQAILQNLFFATLNQRMGKNKQGKLYRGFALEEGYPKNRTTHGVDTSYRYEEHFREPEKAVDLFVDVPFLNGGLFECLDRTEEGKAKQYLDGFSRNAKKRAHVPNFLFFSSERKVDLSKAYGEAKRKNDVVRGLLPILHSYKFTIVENTPIDQEIALDPELLGKVFENLLASYNEETKTTARKQTGSFYTPRAIVDYMVDESLKAHLTGVLVKTGTGETEAKARIELLFAYTDEPHGLGEPDAERLLEAIHACKILDPACGSGAFPMGVLHKLVFVIHKLDPDNTRWKQLQIDAAGTIPDPSAREAAIEAIEDDFASNDPDYGRKLYLIEKCLYGVDIQPIAIQISKLRFFISLVSDQRTNRAKKDNHGIRPLPNLETKFVAANTLLRLIIDQNLELFASRKVKKLEAELERVRNEHFTAITRARKLTLQARDKKLREDLRLELKQSSFADEKTSTKLAAWDPYDPQNFADFFEPQWMLGQGVAKGFDIVIGNPPYGAQLSDTEKSFIKDHYHHQDYQLDTYLLFIERGVGLLKDNGVQCLIVPNTWLGSIMFKSIRRFISCETRALCLVDIRTKVFAAVVDNTILCHVKTNAPGNHFPVFEYDGNGFQLRYMQAQDEWIAARGKAVSVSLIPEQRRIAEAIRAHSSINDFFAITPGCKPYQVGKGVPKQTQATVSTKPFTSEKKLTKEFRPLLRGRLINRYQILWNDDLWIEFGDWLAEPRISANYDAPEKIVIRQTGDSLIAALDRRQFVVMNNMFTIVPKTLHAPIALTLASLNSPVLNWYYQTRINPEKGEALAEIKKGHLTQLTIPIVSDSFQAEFDALVGLLGLAKSTGLGAPARFLEDLIDACVMECYFREHMAERNLLFLDELAPHLEKYDAQATESKQREFLEQTYRTLNAPPAKIRNRLLRIAADSPEILAVIIKEGKV